MCKHVLPVAPFCLNGRRTIVLMALMALPGLLTSRALAAATYAYVAGSGSNTIDILDIGANKKIASVATGGIAPQQLAVTPNGAFVYATLSGSNRVAVLRTSDNTIAGSINVGAAPNGIALTPDGSFAYVANRNDGTVSVISTASNAVVATLTVGSHPQGVTASPDGSHVYVCNVISKSVSVISTASKSVTATLNTASTPSAVAVSPDGARVCVAESGGVEVINAATNATVANLAGFASPTALAFAPDGSRVYVANGNGDSVSVLNTASNTITATIGVGPYSSCIPMGIAITPDGRTAYVTEEYGLSISSIDLATNTQTQVYKYFAVYPIGIAIGAVGSTPPPPPPPIYTLTVNSGSGSGSYAAGAVVTVSANAAPAGQVFGQWTGATVATAGSATTTLTMPAANTSVTATYKSSPPVTYTLTVVNGSGSGTYSAGATASISANSAPTGQLFSQWTGATVANPAAASTALTMPAANTTVTATYVSVNAPPTITSQPASQTVNAGQTATFAVNAAGTAPLTYQWQKNGVNVSGATAASYTTPVTTSADSGSTFKCVVSNTVGSASSNAATLTVTVTVVNVAPVITSPAAASPNPATTAQSVAFSAAASDADGDALTYTWNFGDGSSGSGPAASHNFAAVGNYTATATINDGHGHAVVSSVAITVNTVAPSGLQQGGFETPNVGPAGNYGSYAYTPTGSAWTFAGQPGSGSGITGNGSGFTSSNPVAPEGVQAAFIQGAGSFSQTASFPAGTYLLSFQAAQRVNYQSSSQTLRVLVDNQSAGDFHPANGAYTALTTNAFTLTAGNHTIAFLGLNPNGGDNTAFVDNVTVTSVSNTGLLQGGFETPNVGPAGNYASFAYAPSGSAWTFAGQPGSGAGIAANGSGLTLYNGKAPEGVQAAFLQGAGSFSQTASFAAGTYALSFMAAQRLIYQSNSQTFRVLVDNQSAGDFHPANGIYTAFTTNAFTLTAGNHTIAFVGLNPNGGDNTVFIDNVRAVAAGAAVSAAPTDAPGAAPAVDAAIDLGSIAVGKRVQLALPLPQDVPTSAHVRLSAKGLPQGLHVTAKGLAGAARKTGSYTFSVTFSFQTGSRAKAKQIQKATQQYRIVVAP